MKIEKKPWERALTITVVILLAVSVFFSAGISLWGELYANVHSYHDDSFWGLGISAGALLLVCAFFLRRTYSHPFALSFFSLIITFAIFAASVFFFYTKFYCLLENPNYETEYAEWAATDPTPDSDIHFLDLRKMAPSPEKYIETQTSSSRFAESAYIICGISSGICALLFLIYFFFWLPRFFVPLQRKRNQTKAIKKREKAFAQIEKFHGYKEKGIMTDEEYQESRQRVLESIQ